MPGYYAFDAAFGGAQRDEERSHGMERILSVRRAEHGFDPKSAGPELSLLFSALVYGGEPVRVFPLTGAIRSSVAAPAEIRAELRAAPVGATRPADLLR